MSSNITFNGVTYSIPDDGDFNWGPDLTAYFIAIASGALQKTGGTFTLGAETDFGASFGLKSLYFKSRHANPAAAGQLRLGNTESISWRNNANNGDLALTSNASDALLFNSKNVLFSALGLIVDADINAAAAIAYSKLAALTASRLLVSSAGGVVSVSAVTATEAGYLSGVTSAIQTQLNLLAPKASPTFTGTITTPLTASRLVVTGASNELAVSAATATEASYLSGVTSAIQTQMNLKAPLASPTFTGTVTLPATVTGASAQVLTLPTSTSTLATLALAEVLSSKTLTSPQINGLLLARAAKTGNYTLLLTDDFVACDASGGAFTITFPAAASSTNKVLAVKKTDTSFNAVTLSGTGMTTNYLMTVGETARFISDGSTWIQIDRKTDVPWTSYTPSWTGSGSNPAIGNGTLVGRWKRKGDDIIGNIRIVMGSTTTYGTGTYIWTIPNSSGWTVSTLTASGSGTVLGFGVCSQGGAADDNIVPYLVSTTTVSLKASKTASTVGQLVPFTWANGNYLDFQFTVPITNFSP